MPTSVLVNAASIIQPLTEEGATEIPMDVVIPIFLWLSRTLFSAICNLHIVRMFVLSIVRPDL